MSRSCWTTRAPDCLADLLPAIYLLLICVLLICGCEPARSGPPAAVDPPAAHDRASGEFEPAAPVIAPPHETPAAERIVELPEDGEVWHTSLFVHAHWQTRKADRELVAAFESDPQLRSLKAQTKFHLYEETDPIYRQRFAQHLPTLPAVVVQRGNGEVVFKSSALNLDPPSLGGQVATQIYQYRCDNGYCQPQPVQPAPKPPLFTPPKLPASLAPEPIPDLLPLSGLSTLVRIMQLVTDGRVWAALGAGAFALLWWRSHRTAQQPRRVSRRRPRSKRQS